VGYSGTFIPISCAGWNCPVAGVGSERSDFLIPSEVFGIFPENNLAHKISRASYEYNVPNHIIRGGFDTIPKKYVMEILYCRAEMVEVRDAPAEITGLNVVIQQSIRGGKIPNTAPFPPYNGVIGIFNIGTQFREEPKIVFFRYR